MKGRVNLPGLATAGYDRFMTRPAARHKRRSGTDDSGRRGGIPRRLNSNSRWKDAALFGAIVLFAFTLRLTYILQLQDNPTFNYPHMDELYHDDWAQAIAAGETFIEGPYFRAPLYPAFLAAIYKVFGVGYLLPRIIQGILGSLSCGVLFLIGRRIFGRAIGAVAGFVAGSYWMLIYFDGELLIPSLIVFLDLLLIWVLLWTVRTPRAVVYGLAGITLGLSAIARPNILLFGPALVVWLAIMYRRQLRRALLYITCLTSGCLLVVLPITVRNYVVGNDLVLIASQGGVNFYIGNNPEADGWAAVVPGTPPGWWSGYYATIERAEEARGRELKPSEVSQYYFEQAREFIFTQPGKYCALLGLKLRLFWSRWEISNNKFIYFQTEHFTPIVKYLPLGFAVLGPLGILGLVMCWRRRMELFPLWGFVVVYMVSVVLFFCNARYRTPILPPLILLAVWAIFEGVAAVRRQQWRSLAGGLAVLMPAALLVYTTPNAELFHKPRPESYVRLGDEYDRLDQLDLALENYRQALELAPHYLTARRQAGLMLSKMKRFPEAITEFRHALTLEPSPKVNESAETVATVHYHLANVLNATGAQQEAIKHYRASIELDPLGGKGRSQFNLGVLLIKQGQQEAALSVFEQGIEPLRAALESNPDDSKVLYALGRSLFLLGRYGEALAPLRECLRITPGNFQALDNFTEALMKVGHYQEAGELLRRALPLGQPSLVNRLAFLLATCPDDGLRDGRSSLEYARRLCPQTGSCQVEYLDTLAAALAEIGSYEEAITVARQAIERISREQSPEESILVKQLRERLRLYESRRPYRQPRP